MASRQGGDAVARVGRIVAGRTVQRGLRVVPVVLAAVAALVIALTAAGGGFARVQDDDVEAGALRQWFDAGPFRVSIVGVRVLPESEDLFHLNQGDRWVAIVADVEAGQDPVSLTGMQSVIKLRGVAGLRSTLPTEAVLARDGGTLISLQPGLPERIGIVWEQNAAAPVPRTARVDLFDEEYVASTLTGEYYWRPTIDRPEGVPALKLADLPVQNLAGSGT